MNRNYNNKKSQNNKQDRKEMPKDNTPVSGLTNVGLPDGDTLFSVNATKVDVGSTAAARELFIQHLIVSDPFSASIDGPNSLISTSLEELINAYATARGYVTSVTPSVIESYVVESYKYLAILLHTFRAQNGSQIVGDEGYLIGKYLGSRPSVQSTTGQVANYIGDNGASIGALVFDGDVSISNTDWSRKWLADLVHVKLTRGQIQFAVAMFSKHYLMVNGTTGIVTPIPNYLISASSAQTVLDAAKSAMASLRSTHKDLVDILNFLGFTNDIVISMDFTRDARGLSADIVQDLNFEAAYFNAYAPASALLSGDDDLSNLYYDYFGSFSPLNYVDRVDLDATTVFNSLLLRACASDHFQVIEFTSGVAAGAQKYNFPILIQPDGLTITAFTAAQYARLVEASVRQYAVPFPKLPILLTAFIEEFAPGDYQIFTSITSGVVESYNAYKLPDTYDYYKSAKIADILMGDVQWRTAVQMLTNSIRSQSITRKS